jgi:hypothetical protein
LLLFFKKEALAYLRAGRQERKRFFFEKKKQKTFMTLDGVNYGEGAALRLHGPVGRR